MFVCIFTIFEYRTPGSVSSKCIQQNVDSCIRFVEEARILKMGRRPPKPSESKFIRQSVDYCLRFVEDARILKYGPGAAKGVREQIHKAKL